MADEGFAVMLQSLPRNAVPMILSKKLIYFW